MLITDELKVKQANISFYDKVGAQYEQFDGRRSDKLADYVRSQIRYHQSDSLLDLGCGSGFVSRQALGIYKQVFALDISHKILHDIRGNNLMLVNADLDYLPFKDNSFDCVVTFATLHHCYGFERIFNEIYRVLRPRGLYYSDHDMCDKFYSRYSLPLKIYRSIFNSLRRYQKNCPAITDDDYNLSEYHSTGIPIATIEDLLKDAGFSSIKMTYHWFGLSPLTDRLFGQRQMSSYCAPLVKIKAIK